MTMERHRIIFSFLILLGVGIIGGALYVKSRRSLPAPSPVVSEPPVSLEATSTPSGSSSSAPATSALPRESSRSLADCAGLARSGLRLSCFGDVLTGTSGPKACEAVGEKGREECDAWFVIAAASTAGDPEKCKPLVNDRLRSICEASASAPPAPPAPSSAPEPADADRDGLSDADEALYGTDASNSDTDGDGFSDGEEVKEGYNPNGAGKL